MKYLVPLLGHLPLVVKVLGGSIISNYGLSGGEQTIGEVLDKENKNLYVKRDQSISGLTFSKAIPAIESLNTTDILVLYFGTSVGWPRISRKMIGHLQPELLKPTSFHLPVYKSEVFYNRFKAKLRHFERNVLKLALFPFGLYRPRQSLEDLPDLVTAIQHLAEKKSGLIIWVQHHSLGYKRLWLERKIYSRFYRDIMKEIYTHRSPHFRIITLDKSFLVQENFLIDGVHFSAIGHHRMADLIYSEIESALTEAREYIKIGGASL
jgi:hypothetical protein